MWLIHYILEYLCSLSIRLPFRVVFSINFLENGLKPIKPSKSQNKKAKLSSVMTNFFLVHKNNTASCKKFREYRKYNEASIDHNPQPQKYALVIPSNNISFIFSVYIYNYWRDTLYIILFSTFLHPNKNISHGLYSEVFVSMLFNNPT